MGKTFRQDAKYSNSKFGKKYRKHEQIKKFKTKRGKLLLKEARFHHIMEFGQEDKKGHKI